jgi:7-carboxy-7-deazaguanine synthase
MEFLKSLTVSEIYASIQGESRYAGFPCTFIRLTGCPLRCKWCDTAHAFKGGQTQTIEAIVAEVARNGVPVVELTGGEPLAQPNAPALMSRLLELGYQVLLETSGSEDIAPVPSGVHIVMDLKAPDSKMSDKNLWSNLQHLKATDDVKFVLASRADFDWALSVIARESLVEKCQVLLSCAWGLVEPKDLSAWMLEHPTARRCRLQLQQHKYIWGPRTKGV